MSGVKRIAVLGRGGAGKSTFAARLARENDLPLIELDQFFWKPGPTATPPDEWVAVQTELIDQHEWVIDGDLGPYDTALNDRLSAAEAVVILNFALWRCVWRALRRGPENREFWTWVFGYRRRSLPVIMETLNAGSAPDVFVARKPSDLPPIANLL
ncbi:MAG: adenylate kinase [Gordonia sp. (in: high G+C Gram-positive bacteria)]|uniref:adenylate kinase n=1 Tax=Gordonia sp. (in: high G+C Gram-positive bacteria) TaxID=84139 RepID=UPI0039E32C02